MITDKLQKEFNVQIAAEMWSSNLYMSMAYYLDRQGLDGMACWMKKQAHEELEHAYRFADYLASRGGVVKVDKIDVVPQGWGAVGEVFESVYKHECHVSKLIDNLYELAVAEKDYASQDFLMTFVREQVEEEATALSISEKIKMAGNNDSAMLLLDAKLGTRK
ncbi:MAG: ferritin [Candidatus Aphodosoma sp.]